LNLNISASSQSIKNLVGNFGAIYEGYMHTNFQASSSIGVGGGGSDRRKDRCHAIFGRNRNEISKFPFPLPWEELKPL